MIEVAIKQRLGAFELDASFTAPDGVTALFGRSGSGKTSVINATAGLSRPDSGQIVVNGRKLFGDGVFVPAQKRRVGYVFQDARLFPHMNVQDNLRYGGQHNETDVVEILGLSSLLERRPANLSGGEKQRVAIGRALMCNPDLLLLDEPLAALDGPRKAEILPYLETLRDRSGVPMIYVSHAIAEVARLATTLVIMQDGRVQQVGPVNDVLADPRSVTLLGRADAGAVLLGQVTSHDANDALTKVQTGAGEVLLQGEHGQVGQALRLRVPAQDVILSLDAPAGLSALNALPVIVTEITPGDGPALAIGLKAGSDRLLAQISTRSAKEMDLVPGKAVFAIFKVTAVTPDFGRSR